MLLIIITWLYGEQCGLVIVPALDDGLSHLNLLRLDDDVTVAHPVHARYEAGRTDTRHYVSCVSSNSEFTTSKR